MTPALMRCQSFLGIQAKTALDKSGSWAHFVFMQCFRQARFNRSDIAAACIGPVLLHVFVAEPGIGDLILQDSTHGGDALSGGSRRVKELLVGEESVCLKRII
jgi:hypothetical protein